MDVSLLPESGRSVLWVDTQGDSQAGEDPSGVNSVGQKRSKDIAALAVELGCAQILVLHDHQSRGTLRDSEGVPGSYNHPPRGGPCLLRALRSAGREHRVSP